MILIYKKTYTVEILFCADKEYELGENIYEAIDNTMDYSDVISGYEINIESVGNVW